MKEDCWKKWRGGEYGNESGKTIRGEVHLWEVDSGSELLHLVFHEGVVLLNTEPSDVFPLAFFSDGKTLVSGAFD